MDVRACAASLDFGAAVPEDCPNSVTTGTHFFCQEFFQRALCVLVLLALPLLQLLPRSVLSLSQTAFGTIEVQLKCN